MFCLSTTLRSFSAIAVCLIVTGALPFRASAVHTEFRGIWVDSWGAGIHTPSQVDQLVADAQAGNFNAILPQVVRRGDAFYESELLPKTTSISSNYDPLADLIQKAAAADPPIEVHPWIVVYPLWGHEDNPPTQPDHAYNRHPEWLTRNPQGETWDGDNYQLDPGHPEVQQHLHDVAMEIVENYQVDGIHLDYIRYNGRQWGYNETAVARFNDLHGGSGQPSPDNTAWEQFRRDQVTGLVRRIYFSVLESRPEVKVSAATIGWGHGPSSTDGWTSTSAYATVFQDWRAWMEEGILDTNMPMFYFDFDVSGREAMWAGWNEFAKDHKYGRHLSIGPALYLNTVADSIAKIRSTREATGQGNRADGITGYSYRITNDEGVPRSQFLSALTGPSQHDPEPEPVFADPVPVPELTWKTEPDAGHLNGTVFSSDSSPADGALVEVSGPESRTVAADARGFYGLVGLAPGEYTVQASGLNSVVESDEVTVTVEAGEIATRDLTLEAAGGEIVIDNPAAAFEGSWFTGDAGTPYGDDYHWASTTDGAADRTATYTPDIGVAGTYNVYVWYVPGGNRSDNVRYDVVHRDGTETVRVDQSGGGEAWERIATEKYFQEGTSGNVRLSNDTGATGYVVIADAVRWELVDADRPWTFETWAETHFSESELEDPAISGPEADPFGHGVSNLQAYSFGLSPRNPDLARLPAVSYDNDGLLIVYRRLKDDPDTRYAVESSVDLENWEDAASSLTELSSEGDGEGRIETVTLRVEDSSAGTRFFRIRIER